MKKWITTFLAAITMVMNSNAQNCTGERSVGTDDFANIVADTSAIQLVDVRTPEEYVAGHLAGALNIDVSDSTFLKLAAVELTKAKPVAVYCRSGKRSAYAAFLLAGQGYRVVNLLGGIIAWRETGRPVVE